eukprot:CAMPEP_0113513562 /NCGR_PEP_ID=MMETSP0014_2-20120614/39935_1 /TAXON_ID=2857 /ORGANISM="Nitzschia sp." /LENGTH=971 /DNA_ID=CAMNT_0000409987 /DNA_START=271 /DNA_END=3187 /DNA_ORIENTATION=+ /assembly_acc=CAM_ASM_000159
MEQQHMTETNSFDGCGGGDNNKEDDGTTPPTAANTTDEGVSCDEQKHHPAEESTTTTTTATDDEVVTYDDRKHPATEESTTTMSKLGDELVGQYVILHPFGNGIVLEYRESDSMYAIKLSSETSYQGLGVLYTQQVPVIDMQHEEQGKEQERQEQAVDELNIALAKLEEMRRLNLELECHEHGIYDVDFEMCTCCLKERGRSMEDRSHFPRLQKFMDSTSEIDLQQNFPRLNSFFGSTTSKSVAPVPVPLVTDHTANNNVVHNGSSSNPQSTAMNSNLTAALMSDEPSSAQTEVATLARTNPPATINTASSQTPEAAPVPTFPRLNKFWGKIQNLPQPAQQKGTEHKETAAASVGNQNSASASGSTATTTAVSESGGSSFPRIRGFMNSTSTASSSFFDSVPATDGSTTAALPGIFGGASSSTESVDRKDAGPPPSNAQKAAMSKSNASSLASGKPKALPRIQKLMDQRERANTAPCLICASPSCPKHSSSSFRREGITLCLSCERLFELDFIVDCVNQNPAERSKSIDHMIDCYDRCVLMLRYSTRFVEPMAKALEEQKEQQNKIGLGSSSVGVLSGVLGIAAAASILTPAGPPLLIASLFFGGGATAVQTGSEAINYFSEPRKVADRIIALHGMALSLLRVTSTLRDAMLRDHIRTDVYDAEASPAPLSEQMNEKIQKNRVAVLAGSNVGRTLTLGGVAGAEAGAGAAASAATVATVAGAEGTAAGAAAAGAGAGAARGATAFSRAGTAAARTVRFARFAGGALSAAVLVMEANAIQNTLSEISNGNPCHKADTLRRLAGEVEDFPTTSALDDECRAYLEAMENRPPPPTATAVVAVAASDKEMGLAENIPEATCQPATQQLCAPGATILEGDAAPSVDHGASLEIPSAEAVTAEPLSNRLSSSSALFSSVSMSFMGGGGGESGGSSMFQRFQARQEFRQDGRALGRDEVIATVSEGTTTQRHNKTGRN